MSSTVYGANAYQQSAALWQQSDTKRMERTSSVNTEQSENTARSKATSPEIKSSAWSAKSVTSSMIHTTHETYGKTIGDVQLSDKAAEYYDKLKSKFHNLDFMLVSNDMKSQVHQNASQYGNSNRMVVLIDEEKLERMATDESFRKKYEGIIASAQPQLAAMKNQLSSTGAGVKNFGMSVDAGGNKSFFAVTEEANKAQKERIERKAAEKKEARKAADKKTAEKRAEKKAEKKADEKAKEKAEEKKRAEKNERLNYTEYRSSSLHALLRKVSDAAYETSVSSVRTDAERIVGQSFDFRS